MQLKRKYNEDSGCLPFLGEFMQIAYGNCVKEADEAAYGAWQDELQNAVLSGKMDLLRARYNLTELHQHETLSSSSKESCKRGAEREQCNQLRNVSRPSPPPRKLRLFQAISNCDIMDSLQITAGLQRDLKRCEELTGIVDQVQHKN